MVWRSAKLGSTRLQFVPTFYWKSDAAGNVASYCYLDKNNVCQAFKQEYIDTFKAGMKLCFENAVKAGFTTIQIVPHLDSGDSGDWTIRTWRNGIVFNPRARYSGVSYEELMLVPLAQVLAPLAAPGGGLAEVYFALQGEMGATVMRYPNEWKQLISTVRSLFTSPDSWKHSDPAPSSGALGGIVKQIFQPMGALFNQQQSLGRRLGEEGAVLHFGLTFNFDYSDGQQAKGGTAQGLLIVGLFGWAIGGRPGFGAPAFKAADVSALMSAVDFVGISAYAPLNGANFEIGALQNSAYTLFDSFQAAGVPLKEILQKTKAQLHFVEFGAGGGDSQAGNSPAPDPDTASNKLFWGITGQYSKASDPWANPALREFRRSFYDKALAWLQQGTGPQYGVSACYNWGKSSWDVLGTHPESTNSEGSFRDSEIVAKIKAHNEAITGRNW